jgi:hypothetical protein
MTRIGLPVPAGDPTTEACDYYFNMAAKYPKGFALRVAEKIWRDRSSRKIR